MLSYKALLAASLIVVVLSVGYDPAPGDEYGKIIVKSWAYWSDWSECSAECGGGEQTRSRECISEKVEGHGDNVDNCEGVDMETRDCNTQCCAVDGGWSEWTSWAGYGYHGYSRYGGRYNFGYYGRGYYGSYYGGNYGRSAYGHGYGHGQRYGHGYGYSGYGHGYGYSERRMRYCNSPPLSCGGMHCSGDGTEYRQRSAPVHYGAKSMW